ncbi:MAG: SusE domain-containing protein [Carboxylicivirga sp.]|jgi:hypothetical protein|nr:SusE domain-containing protein [Carboxylicivirga sp.]
MNKSIIFLLMGLFAFLVACENEGDKVIMLDSPVAPELVSMPDLNLTRDKGGETLKFNATAVDPGFTASATYYLEASEAGTEFAKVIPVYSGIDVNSIELTVSELNSILLKHFPEDATSSVDFRLRSILTVDAGTGAHEPFEYTSETVTEDVTIFGFMRLDLIDSGMDQKITSPLSDGVYNGFVKLSPDNAFKLFDPETSTTYGGAGGTLSVDGAGIVVDETGWYDFTADIVGLTYNPEPHFIGIIGSATPTGWDSDTDMDYDPQRGYWYIDIDLVGGDGNFIKFRRNDGWGWNMGLADGEEGGLSGNLQQGGVGNDIPIAESGNYRVIFTILSDDAGTYELIKN